MNIRREMAADELEGVVKVLNHWIERLRTPMVMARDGLGNPTHYAEHVPEGASVGMVLANGEEFQMLRGELIATAAKLEGLAST